LPAISSLTFEVSLPLAARSIFSGWSLPIPRSVSDRRDRDAMGRSRCRRLCQLIVAIWSRPTALCGAVRTSFDTGCVSAMPAAACEPSSGGRIEAASQRT
jgi:hypothetical protein